jgi:hypothetical protein
MTITLNEVDETEQSTCRSFQLSPIPIPERCEEAINILKEIFTTKTQWSYLRIYIELYEL